MRTVLRLIFLLTACLPIVAQTYNFTTVDVPEASRTTVNGINNAGDMVGSYFPGQTASAFYYNAGQAKFRTVHIPRSSVDAAYGINDNGEIVGGDYTSAQNGFSFFNNQFQFLNFGAIANYAAGVNNQGAVVGLYLDVCCNGHGYLYQGGQLTTLDFPGGASAGANGINDSNVVVGGWHDSAGVGHGFEWDAGTYTSIDVPGATATNAFGINSQNTIVGFFSDSAGNYHGFVLSGGAYTTVDVPGAKSTAIFGINDSGVLVGQYGMNGKVHGFVAVAGEQ